MIRNILIFLVIAAVVFFGNYSIFLQQKRVEAEENLKIVERTISENFEQVEKILCLIGKKIINENPNLDPKVIHKIFVQVSNTQIGDSLLSWTLFDWVDLQGYQTVSTMFGVKKDPQFMSGRSYRDSGNDAWKIIPSEVALGSPSKVFVIPIGVQVENDKQQRVGTVTAGINIKKLVNSINRRLGKYNRFIMIDERTNRPAFDSNGTQEVDVPNFHTFLFSKKSNSVMISSVSMSPVYPYKILVGYDSEVFWSNVFSSFALQMLQITAIAAMILLVKKKKKSEAVSG